jgi:hypothetical protein
MTVGDVPQETGGTGRDEVVIRGHVHVIKIEKRENQRVVEGQRVKHGIWLLEDLNTYHLSSSKPCKLLVKSQRWVFHPRHWGRPLHLSPSLLPLNQLPAK